MWFHANKLLKTLKFWKSLNSKFFTLRPLPWKRREISGWVQWVKWCSHIGQQMHCWQTVAAGPFWPCFACPKLGDAGRTRVASKNRAVLEKISEILLRENFYISYSLHPFAIHILNRLDMRIHQVAPKIYHTYSKIWVNRDWVICLLFFFFGDFWGREPDLHSEFSDFQNLSVFSNFLAWNHIVCHRYR